MPESFLGRIRNVWNVLSNADQVPLRYQTLGYGTSVKPDRVRLRLGGVDRSIVASIYNRIAIDTSSVVIKHVRQGENKQYLSTIESDLNNCLTLSANIDQTGPDLIKDAVMSMFDEGCVAVVPVDTENDPYSTDSYEIYTLRVGHILEWYAQHIRVRLYDDRTGTHKEVVVPKTHCAIIENPLYAVMNEPNSTLQRLIRKLNLLDRVDEQSSSGKLDLIIQLPYVIKTEQRRQQAETRRKLIEEQLAGSKYGIAYTDGSEKITQLNRAVENNLLQQITALTAQLYSQLGLSESVFDGTADEQTMLNYFNRTIEPILSALCLNFTRTFLTKTARSQRQAITYFQNPFKLVPVANLADIADKFTRNEVLSSNEMRSIIGYQPANDPRADELRNKNINQASEEEPVTTQESDPEKIEAEKEKLDDELDEEEKEAEDEKKKQK